jgi:hypothetical protein
MTTVAIEENASIGEGMHSNEQRHPRHLGDEYLRRIPPASFPLLESKLGIFW